MDGENVWDRVIVVENENCLLDIYHEIEINSNCRRSRKSKYQIHYQWLNIQQYLVNDWK